MARSSGLWPSARRGRAVWQLKSELPWPPSTSRWSSPSRKGIRRRLITPLAGLKAQARVRSSRRRTSSPPSTSSSRTPHLTCRGGRTISWPLPYGFRHSSRLSTSSRVSSWLGQLPGRPCCVPAAHTIMQVGWRSPPHCSRRHDLQAGDPSRLSGTPSDVTSCTSLVSSTKVGSNQWEGQSNALLKAPWTDRTTISPHSTLTLSTLSTDGT
jgi:hypothetical protein